MKRLTIKEFRAAGYLADVNRHYFHPLGMILKVGIASDDTEFISGVVDCRGDKEEMIYDKKTLASIDITKSAIIDSDRKYRRVVRADKLGWYVQPLMQCGNK